MLEPRPIVTALADTMFPPEPDAPGGGEVVPDLLEDLLASMEPADAQQLGVALDLVELGAVPLHGRRFSRLSADARERYLLGWRRSRLPLRRSIFKALRNLCANLYYADERTWEHIGYDGPLVTRGAR